MSDHPDADDYLRLFARYQSGLRDLVHGAAGIGYSCHVFTPSFIEAGLLSDAA